MTCPRRPRREGTRSSAEVPWLLRHVLLCPAVREEMTGHLETQGPVKTRTGV